MSSKLSEIEDPRCGFIRRLIVALDFPGPAPGMSILWLYGVEFDAILFSNSSADSKVL